MLFVLIFFSLYVQLMPSLFNSTLKLLDNSQAPKYKELRTKKPPEGLRYEAICKGWMSTTYGLDSESTHMVYCDLPLWRIQMVTFFALLALCAGDSRVTGESPSKGQWRGSLMVFFYLWLNKRLSKQTWGMWFETPSRSLWRHCNALCHERLFFQCYLERLYIINDICNDAMSVAGTRSNQGKSHHRLHKTSDWLAAVLEWNTG